MRAVCGRALLGLAVLAAGVYLLLPWLTPLLLERLARGAAVQVVDVEVGRPGWTRWQVPRLVLRQGERELRAAAVELDYHWRGLLAGELTGIQVGRLALTLAPGAISGFNGEPDDAATVLPQGPPAAWLALLPWHSLSIRQLQIEVPARAFAATGVLQQDREGFRLSLSGQTPDIARGYQLRAGYGENEGLSLLLGDPAEDEPLVQVASRFGRDRVAIDATANLTGYAASLLLTLAGLPDAEVDLMLQARTALPWPLTGPLDWRALEVQGRWQLSAALSAWPGAQTTPDVTPGNETVVPAQSGTARGRVAGDDPMMVLDGLAGSFSLTSAELTAELQSGSVRYRDATSGSEMSGRVRSPVLLDAGAWGLRLGSGLDYVLSGDRGDIRGSLERFDYTRQSGAGAPARLELALSYAARVAGLQESGALALTMQQQDTGPVLGQGHLTLTSGRLLPVTGEGALKLPFEFEQDLASGRGTLSVDHAWRWQQPLFTGLRLVEPGGWDLGQGRAAYRGRMTWGDRDAGKGATVAVALDGKLQALQLVDGADGLVPGPLDLAFELESEESALSLSGQLSRDSLLLPFSVTAQLATGRGGLRVSHRLALRRPLLSTLFPGQAFPGDLDGGALILSLEGQWTPAGALRWDGALQLAEGKAHYDDYQANDLTGELSFQGVDEDYRIRSGKLAAGTVSIGFPLTGLRAEFSGDYTPSQAMLTIRQLEAGTLGGRVLMDRFDVDLRDFSGAGELRLQDLALAQVLALEGDKVAGEGTLQGVLPLRLTEAEPSISGGRIQADPPGGVIRVDPSLTDLVSQPGLAFAVQALSDFRFDALSADVSYAPDGELLLAVSLKGRNPAVEQGRPIHYNLNVSENLHALLESLRASRAFQDRVERRMNR